MTVCILCKAQDTKKTEKNDTIKIELSDYKVALFNLYLAKKDSAIKHEQFLLRLIFDDNNIKGNVLFIDRQKNLLRVLLEKPSIKK
jgi:CRISPR/Cas system CMR-associated protein Cmr1 (group 7 of RAMP superfamily)